MGYFSYFGLCRALPFHSLYEAQEFSLNEWFFDVMDVPISLLVMLLIHMFLGLSWIVSDRFSDLLLQEWWYKSSLGRLYAFLSPFLLDGWNNPALQLLERSANVFAFAEFFCILKVILERNVMKKNVALLCKEEPSLQYTYLKVCWRVSLVWSYDANLK